MMNDDLSLAISRLVVKLSSAEESAESKVKKSKTDEARGGNLMHYVALSIVRQAMEMLLGEFGQVEREQLEEQGPIH